MTFGEGLQFLAHRQPHGCTKLNLHEPLTLTSFTKGQHFPSLCLTKQIKYRNGGIATVEQ